MDYLWLNLQELPCFRALLRAVEARFYQDIDLPAPVLDLGCGDGHFASMALDRPPDVGLDPWPSPLKKAARRQFYPLLVQADGGEMPFPSASFASALSNSVLEHIPPLEEVLHEVARVLKPGAPFIFCVPNHNFLPNLSVARFFDRARLPWLATAYRGFFNRISRHHHCDPPEAWERRLEQAGFLLERWWHYFSPAALQALEWGHYFGLPSLVIHAVTRRWLLSSSRWNLWLTERWVRPFYEEEQTQPLGVYTFYMARRMDNNG